MYSIPISSYLLMFFSSREGCQRRDAINGPIDPSKVGALMNVSDLESKGEEVSHDTYPESLQCLKGRHSSKQLKLREVLKQLRKIEKNYIIS